MYVHRRCKPSKAELDLERKAHGYCGICGNQGTIWLVRGTKDSYRTKRQGVTKTVTAVGTLTDKEVAFIKTKVNTTDIPITEPLEAESPAYNEPSQKVTTEPVEVIEEVAAEPEKAPEEMPPEAESKPLNEMTKAELLATIKEREIDAAAEITALEAESEPSVEEVTKYELEPDATREDVEIIKAAEESLKDATIEDLTTEGHREPLESESEPIVDKDLIDAAVEAEKARKATIARLEAELEALRN